MRGRGAKVTAALALPLALSACFIPEAGRGRIGPPLDAAAFAALVDGRVMQSLPPGGGPANAWTESFLPGNRSCLSGENGSRPGIWRQNGQLICHIYPDAPQRQFCNSYHRRGDELMAFTMGDMRRLPFVMQDWQGIAPDCGEAFRG